MADSDEGRDPSGGNRSAQPGGSPSRGPNPDPGGEKEEGGLVPPYDDRTSGAGDGPASEERAESVKRQLAETKTGNVGETASPAEELSVSEGEVSHETPESPKGVGQSMNRRGEDVADAEDEPGREHGGTKGESDRPFGKSDERDTTSVDPHDGSGGAPQGGQGG